MNLLQTRLDTGTAIVPPLAACGDGFANRKTYSGAMAASAVDADQAKTIIDTHADEAVPCDPQPARGDVARTGAVAGRISATVAAADKVARYHADAQAARAAQVLQAEFGVDRVPIPRFSDGEML